MPSPEAISIAQLSKLIGTPDCPVILDLRIDEDFNTNPLLIPTSLRIDYQIIENLAPSLNGQKVVIACHKGLKISQGAAAILRISGIRAEFLEGGVVAWTVANLPMISIAAGITPSDQIWVTRHRPKIDRIACPWLIRRFIDPNAKFLFVEPSQVEAVADRFNAIPFDIEGGQFSHRGELCSFDVIMQEFGIDYEPLHKLATIIRGADTNKHDLAPEAAGLLAISLGLSRMNRDDLAQLDDGMLIYDALFRWARDAENETHASGLQS